MTERILKLIKAQKTELPRRAMSIFVTKRNVKIGRHFDIVYLYELLKCQTKIACLMNCSEEIS